MKINVFNDYSVPKAVAYMALPTMLSMLVNIFYNMADTYFVGQTNNELQLAAVSLTMPVFLLIMAVGNMFGVGGSAFIARTLGMGNKEKVKKISSFCFYGAVFMGVLLTIILLVFINPILHLLGCSQDTFLYAKEYLEVIGSGSIFIVLSFAFGHIVRGEGGAIVSMTGMMIGTITNIILDYWFIIELSLGVKGAAIATIIGNICATIFYVLYLTGKKTILSISLKYFKITKHMVISVISIGIPASLNNILMSLSNIILNQFLKEINDTAVAAMGVAMKANMMVVMLQLGLAIGISPLIGYNYGAGNFKKLKKIMKFSMLCNCIIGSVITLIYIININKVVGAFTDKALVIEYGEKMLRALMISGPIVGIMFVFSFSFQAMGKTLASLVLSISRQGFVFVPIVIIGYKFAKLHGILFAQPIADIVSLIIAITIYIFINNKDRLRNDATNNATNHGVIIEA